MEHIPQAVLEGYADDPERVQDRAAIELHLTNCEGCRDHVKEIRLFTNALRDPGIWIGLVEDDVPSSADDLALLAFERQVDAEDAEAEELVRELLDESPSGFVWENIPAQDRFRTGGVVRLLSAEAHKACEKKTRRALSLAQAATAIAEALPDTTYPYRSIYDIRGVAWKECANAHRYLGNLPAALDALTRAERAFRKGPAPELGVAIVSFVRATVLWEQERLDDALDEVRKATRAFEELRLTSRYVAARTAHGVILYQAKRFAEAHAMFAQVLAYGEANNDKEWIARASLNIGKCDLETGDYTAAMTEMRTAKRLFTELDLSTEILRADSGIGRILVALGRRSEGIQRLDAASRAFASAGMTQDTALTTLFALEARLPDGPSEELALIAEGLVKTFVAAGRLTGALTALAYVKELAVKKRLTSGALAYVREFLNRSERRPDLVFAPPSPPD